MKTVVSSAPFLIALILLNACSSLNSKQADPKNPSPASFHWTTTDPDNNLQITLSLFGVTSNSGQHVAGEIALRNISKMRQRIFIPGIRVFLSAPASSTLPMYNPLIKKGQEYIELSPGKSISYKFEFPFRVDELRIHAAYLPSPDARQYLVHERWVLHKDVVLTLPDNALPEE